MWGSHDAYHLLVEYDDGSSASIVYADASDRATPKERIEINGRGHTVVLDNYRSLVADGTRVKVADGKGHAEGLAAFVGGGLDGSAGSAIVTTQIALAAAELLASG